MSEPGIPPAQPAVYDVPMLRDFIEQLSWCVRAAHAQATHQDGREHPELAEQLRLCASKRGIHSLILANRITPDPTGRVTLAEATRHMRKFEAVRTGMWLTALGQLDDLFAEAFDCAERLRDNGPQCVPVRQWDAPKVIEGFDGVDPDDVSL